MFVYKASDVAEDPASTAYFEAIVSGDVPADELAVLEADMMKHIKGSVFSDPDWFIKFAAEAADLGIFEPEQP
ncbi:MAG: hypothetical protein AB8B83_00700 [Bdellovibrionales bacterium]